VTRRFAITFDYLCPFARNANEHVIAGLRDDADWDVTFRPHSLAQGHVGDGEPALWDRDEPSLASGVLALQIGLAVRDQWPERFLAVHQGLFAARHDDGSDIKDPAVVWAVLEDAALDPEEVFGLVAGGKPLRTLRDEHEADAREHHVWGVPTFIASGRAVFVRLLDRPGEDQVLGRQRIEQVLDLLEGAVTLHEFKRTEPSG
jgi:predicted DsbA family dithiol-disulfide isomerase